MKVILHGTWQGLCLVSYVLLCVTTFFLWSAIAAGAGWVLLHLTDVWSSHLEGGSSKNFAVAAITAYAIVAGALFFAFSSGALQLLEDAYVEIRVFARARRSQRVASSVHRQRRTT